MTREEIQREEREQQELFEKQRQIAKRHMEQFAKPRDLPQRKVWRYTGRVDYSTAAGAVLICLKDGRFNVKVWVETKLVHLMETVGGEVVVEDERLRDKFDRAIKNARQEREEAKRLR